MDQEQMNIFYANKRRHGIRYTQLYFIIKNTISHIAEIEFKIHFYKLYLLNDIVPKNFILKNHFINSRYPTMLRHMQWILFKKHYHIIQDNLVKLKSELSYFKKLLQNNFDSIIFNESILLLNSYKTHLDTSYFIRLQKTIHFFKYKGLKTNIFKFKFFNNPIPTLLNATPHFISIPQSSIPSNTQSNILPPLPPPPPPSLPFNFSLSTSTENNSSDPIEYTHHNTGFINLSSFNFPIDMVSFLSQGPKATYSALLHKHDDIVFKSEIEYILRNSLSNDSNINDNLDINKFNPDFTDFAQKFKNKSTNSYINETNNLSVDHSSHLILKKVLHLSKHNNVTILLADKTNSLVAINTETYIIDMKQALFKNNFSIAKRKKNKTNHNKIKSLISELKINGSINQTTYSLIYPTSSTPCTITGKYKSHKPQGGIHPIINTKPSYMAATSRWLNKLLSKYNPSKFNIKNSNDLILSLQKVKLQKNYTLMSLDIESMFGSVDVEYAISFLLSSYQADSDKPFNMTLSNLDYLLRLCLTDVPCIFQGDIYVQTRGTPMGGSLSGLISDINVSNIENSVMSLDGMGTGPNRSIIFLKRFVDDFLLIIANKDCQDDILSTFNNQSPFIKFTSELENNSKLNFLDITLHRFDSHFEFSVHRKPQQNSIKINFCSHYPIQTKRNILIQELKRAYNTCSTESLLSKELNNIEYSFLLNNYPLWYIRKYNNIVCANYVTRSYPLPLFRFSFKKPTLINYKSHPVPLPPLPDIKFLTYPKYSFHYYTPSYYYNTFHYFHQTNLYNSLALLTQPNSHNVDLTQPIIKNFKYVKINNIHHFNILNKTFNSLKNSYPPINNIRLVAPSPPTFKQFFRQMLNLSGNVLEPMSIIYSIYCSCNKFYIGCTGRGRILRLHEHLKSDKNSIVYKHISDSGHIIFENNCHIIFAEQNQLKRFILESIFISTSSPTLNRSGGLQLLINQI